MNRYSHNDMLLPGKIVDSEQSNLMIPTTLEVDEIVVRDVAFLRSVFLVVVKNEEFSEANCLKKGKRFSSHYPDL